MSRPRTRTAVVAVLSCSALVSSMLVGSAGASDPPAAAAAAARQSAATATSTAATTPSAGGSAGACAAPVASTTQPGYTIADPHCDLGTNTPFTPLKDRHGRTTSTTYAGIADGSAYRIEVPKNWNHELVLFAHGYRGTGTTVWVDSPTLRTYYIEHGFAWAASSFETNGYDVAHGVTDTHALIPLFSSVTGRTPKDLYMSGLSMGGHITAVEIEKYRNTFVGAMPYCGVLGDTSLFDYFLDANVTAAALTGTAITFPTTPAAGAAYTPVYDQQVLTNELPQLGTGFNTPNLSLTDAGEHWRAAVERASGGERPGFSSSFRYWNSFGYAPLTNVPFLYGLYPGLTGGTIGIASGNVTSNLRTVYQYDDKAALTRAEQRLNDTVLRVTPTASATADLSGIPAVLGDPRIPVLSVHGIGDLFVPFSMEQIYAQRAAQHGESNLFVSRAIRESSHCGYTQDELKRGFADLVKWVRTGHRAAGDDILDPKDVADRAFGCRFTDGPHPDFSGPACPRGGRH